MCSVLCLICVGCRLSQTETHGPHLHTGPHVWLRSWPDGDSHFEKDTLFFSLGPASRPALRGASQHPCPWSLAHGPQALPRSPVLSCLVFYSRAGACCCLLAPADLLSPLSISPTFFTGFSLNFPGSAEQPEVLLVAQTAHHQQEAGPVPAPCSAQRCALKSPGNLRDHL